MERYKKNYKNPSGIHYTAILLRRNCGKENAYKIIVGFLFISIGSTSQYGGVPITFKSSIDLIFDVHDIKYKPIKTPVPEPAIFSFGIPASSRAMCTDSSTKCC